MFFNSLCGKIGITAFLIVAFEFGGYVAAASAQVTAQANSEDGFVGRWYGEIVPSESAPFRLLDIKKDGTCYWAVYTAPRSGCRGKKQRVNWIIESARWSWLPAPSPKWP